MRYIYLPGSLGCREHAAAVVRWCCTNTRQVLAGIPSLVCRVQLQELPRFCQLGESPVYSCGYCIPINIDCHTALKCSPCQVVPHQLLLWMNPSLHSDFRYKQGNVANPAQTLSSGPSMRARGAGLQDFADWLTPPIPVWKGLPVVGTSAGSGCIWHF